MATTSPANPPEVEALYPEGSIPENRIKKLSALCSFGHTQLVMTGAIKQLLIQHFADPENVISASLRRYLEREGGWTEGETTGLYIEPLDVWRPELTEARPAVIIKGGDWNWKRMGIGDQMGEDYRSGRRYFGGFWYGTHTLFALGNQGAETQILASELAKLLVWFGPLIANQFNLHRFILTTIGALSALKEATENYVVPVTVAYVTHETWFLQEDAPRLKRIVFNASEILGR